MLPMQHKVSTFSALSDITRLRLFDRIARHSGQPVSVQSLCDALGLVQPTVSHHLALLRRARLVRFRQLGRSHLYELADGIERRHDGRIIINLGTGTVELTSVNS